MRASLQVAVASLAASLAPAQVCSAGNEPGCICQVPDATGAGEDAHPSNGPGNTISANDRVADGFRTGNAPVVLRGIAWWGTYVRYPEGIAAVPPVQVFTLRLRAAVPCTPTKSRPGDVVFQFDVRTGPGGSLLAEGPTGNSITFRGVNAPEYRYSFTLPVPVYLPANTELWLEITETQNDAFTWGWEVSTSGDGYFARDLSSNGYTCFDKTGGDLAWCLSTEPISTTASCAFRNGSGANAPHYSCLTDPVLGETWQTRIKLTPYTLSTHIAFATGGPHPGLPTRAGELLIALSPPPALAHGLGVHDLPIPLDGALIGFILHTQGFRIDSPPGGVVIAPLNAQDLVLGF